MDEKIKVVNYNDIEIETVETSDGNIWYPVHKVFSDILLKNNTAQHLVEKIKEKDAITKFEKLKFKRKAGKTVFYIRKDVLEKIIPTTLTDTSKGNGPVREEAVYKFYQWLTNQEDGLPLFRQVYPTEHDYDEWEMLCFKTDQDIKDKIIWKRCLLCGKYYPNTMHYFEGKSSFLLSTKCLRCSGYDFFSQSYDMQALKFYNRLSLNEYILKNDVVGLYKEFEERPFEIPLEIFQTPEAICKIIAMLKMRSVKNPTTSWSSSTISYVTKIPKVKITMLLNQAGFENLQDAFINISDVFESHKKRMELLAIKSEDRRKILNKKYTQERLIRLRRETEKDRAALYKELKRFARKNTAHSFSSSKWNKCDKRTLGIFLKDNEIYVLREDDGYKPSRFHIRYINVIPSNSMSINKAKQKIEKILDIDEEL